MEEQLAAEAGIVFLGHGQNHVQNLRLLNEALEEVKGGRMEPRFFSALHRLLVRAAHQ